MKFEVLFDTQRCKGCELCTLYCNFNLIKMNSEDVNSYGVHPATIQDNESCVGCMNCAIMCPDAVISIDKKEENEGGADNV